MPSCAKALLLAATAIGAAAQTVAPFLEIDGRPAASSQVQITSSAMEITAALVAHQEGTYRFGISISSPDIAPLAPGMPHYTCESLREKLTLRYPYDWTARISKGNALSSRPRLIMPGFQAGGRLYIVDTHELFSLTLEPCGHGATLHALLLAQHVLNDGGDRAVAELKLHPGDASSFTVRMYPDLPAANLARFGQHAAMRGFMTQPAYREWTTEPLTQAGYEKVGSKLRGVFQYIIVREVDSPGWIPEILHRNGLQAIHYQYMGALRRFSTQLTPEIQRAIEMRDKNGQLYTAPAAPNGNWLLADIRRPEIRDRFVGNARAAVRAGFDGVFLDGYPFWADATGDIGGNVPGATHSLAYARWLLLREIKNAIREENPKATLGVLANQYFDSLGEADWAAKERMYFEWQEGVGRRSVKIRKDLDHAYEENEAPYAAGPLAYGAKGGDPIPVQSAIHFIVHPTGLVYTDAGDFPKAELDQWLDVVRSVIAEKDLYISDIQPATCWIAFPSTATIRSDSLCKVQFSRPLCVSVEPGGHQRLDVQSISIQPNVLYGLARTCKSGEGVAH